ncbi:MAG: TIGR03915 family putative DNA repair protein, partial [Clostridiales bacterium]|nr:TIGR03915 family putative DNA repair protein [Clostridiales bacterium]
MKAPFRNSDYIYTYDGSFDGLLCCLFTMYTLREIPATVEKSYGGFLPVRTVSSDSEKAARVHRGIFKAAGERALHYGETAYLSEREGIDKQILLYFKLCLDMGGNADRLLGEDCVHAVHEASRYTMGERHRMIQFLRFSDSGEVLTAVISPRANVLPLLAGHFAARFPRERFLIYDSTRGMALVCEKGKKGIVALEEYEQPAPDETEQRYRDLFCVFYKTIEIKERHNEKLRMQHMPKRFWKNMTEFLN